MRRSGILAAWLALFVGLSSGNAVAQKPAEPGRFDYYLLSLSWSPEYCADRGDRADRTQCGTERRYGFIVHGLWPQYERGGYPASCESVRGVPRMIADTMLPIMPSRSLIDHQWKKHGTCSGLDAERYFTETREAFSRIRIPDPLQSPKTAVSMTADEIQALFAQENPGLADARMSVRCSGQYVSEIRICLDRDLSFRDCGRDVRDSCGDGKVIFRPVR